MPRFCANLSWMFNDLPYLDRFEAAAQAGFRAVEVLFPYAEPAGEVTERLKRYGLQMALINFPPPSYTEQTPGFAALPGAEARFRSDFKRSMRYVAKFNAQHLHMMAGVAHGPEARETFVRNLRWAVAEAPMQSLTIEPINTYDMPGYFLNDFDLAAEILDEIAVPNLNLQFDAYHAQRIHGDALGMWDKYGHRAVHVQVAQTPDRSEPTLVPTTPEGIDYAAFFAKLDADGYRGWVSGEYRPKLKTSEGVAWIR